MSNNIRTMLGLHKVTDAIKGVQSAARAFVQTMEACDRSAIDYVSRASLIQKSLFENSENLKDPVDGSLSPTDPKIDISDGLEKIE